MRWLVFAVSAFLLLLTGDFLRAQSSDSKTSAERKPPEPRPAQTAKNNGKARRAVAITPEREAAVLNFVQRNHAELVDLLAYLKTNQPDEYERAIREIFRTTERLALIQERDPLQYELEVAAWSAQSHVQLLAARLQMGVSDDLIKQLRAALVEQQTARLALLKHDRQKTADRLAKIDTDLSRYENDHEAQVERQLKTLTRAAAEGRPIKVNPGKTGTKSAVKAKAKPTKNPTN